MTKATDDSNVKIIDFGLSKLLGPGEVSSDPYGTLAYVAPEVLLQKPYSFYVDSWSLGIIIYVMLSGLLPFDAPSNRETARQTIQDKVPFGHKLWQYVSIDAKDLITQLLHKDGTKRPSMMQVL
jgi:serine/threonine protein kinase